MEDGVLKISFREASFASSFVKAESSAEFASFGLRQPASSSDVAGNMVFQPFDTKG